MSWQGIPIGPAATGNLRHHHGITGTAFNGGNSRYAPLNHAVSAPLRAPYGSSRGTTVPISMRVQVAPSRFRHHRVITATHEYDPSNFSIFALGISSNGITWL